MITQLLAHAGHGHTDDSSLLHYLIEPAHLPYTLPAAVVVVALVFWGVRRRREA